jgi:multisubunit Na+/H+ antiporter MnhG subunit
MTALWIFFLAYLFYIHNSQILIFFILLTSASSAPLLQKAIMKKKKNPITMPDVIGTFFEIVD